VQSIALHEFGHWLGMLDLYGPGDADKVMYGLSYAGEVKRTPTADDIAGIRWIYPGSLPMPAVTGLSPNSGPLSGGTTVTISGANFTGVSAVTFGDTAATSFSVDSLTRIRAVAPPHTAGTVGVRVTTSVGTSADTPADDFTYTAFPPPSQFSDVGSNHPYYLQINDLAARGIINGFADGTFKPDAVVMRQQFAKTLVLPVTDSVTCPFVDVGRGMDPEDPFYPDKYVGVCAAYGITEGKEKNPPRFAPYENISRQQLITMVARAAGLSEPPAGYLPSFSAGLFYPDEHYWNARRAAYAGLLDGLEGLGSTLDYFLAPATRGEVCVLLYNMLPR